MIDRYEGSDRQRRHKRRTRIMAALMALCLLVPIVVGTIAVITR